MRAYRAQARYDYAWVCLDDAPLQDIPLGKISKADLRARELKAIEAS